jgi:hypothetical protein
MDPYLASFIDLTSVESPGNGTLPSDVTGAICHACILATSEEQALELLSNYFATRGCLIRTIESVDKVSWDEIELRAIPVFPEKEGNQETPGVLWCSDFFCYDKP